MVKLTDHSGYIFHILINEIKVYNVSNTNPLICQNQWVTIILFKMLFIDDIYFRSVYLEKGSYNLPSNDIIRRMIFLLYNRSNTDIWNSNANINAVHFDHVVV